MAMDTNHLRIKVPAKDIVNLRGGAGIFAMWWSAVKQGTTAARVVVRL
jgi:tRNA threonylcarbamoyladenosine modification (KEOPS) complex  Pcc1 subunit